MAAGNRNKKGRKSTVRRHYHALRKRTGQIGTLCKRQQATHELPTATATTAKQQKYNFAKNKNKNKNFCIKAEL